MGSKARNFELSENGDPRVWVVWAVSGTGAHQPILVAICSTEEVADRYRPAVEQNFEGARFHAEEAPVDHLFGAVDVRSVAFRTAMREIRRRRGGG